MKSMDCTHSFFKWACNDGLTASVALITVITRLVRVIHKKNMDSPGILLHKIQGMMWFILAYAITRINQVMTAEKVIGLAGDKLFEPVKALLVQKVK